MTREPFRGGVVRGRLVAAAVLALVVLLGAPGHVIACTGETPRLEAITATARLIAEFEVVSVGPDVSVGVPGSFVARVHRIYKGSAPLTMSFEGPTPVGLCDGYIAAVGDRFVMALDARPFPAGGPYNAFWPIRVERGSAAARDDLGSLMAMAAPNDARVADSGDGDTGRDRGSRSLPSPPLRSGRCSRPAGGPATDRRIATVSRSPLPARLRPPTVPTLTCVATATRTA